MLDCHFYRHDNPVSLSIQRWAWLCGFRRCLGHSNIGDIYRYIASETYFTQVRMDEGSRDEHPWMNTIFPEIFISAFNLSLGVCHLEVPQIVTPFQTIISFCDYGSGRLRFFVRLFAGYYAWCLLQLPRFPRTPDAYIRDCSDLLLVLLWLVYQDLKKVDEGWWRGRDR